MQYVDLYKYLGIIIYFKLNFEENCIAVCKKQHQHLFFLHVDETITTLFYRAFIESIVSFSLVSWFGSLSVKNRNSLNRVVKWSSRLIGESQLNPASLYTRQVQRKTDFQVLHSWKRFSVPRSKNQAFLKQFFFQLQSRWWISCRNCYVCNIYFAWIIYLFVDF